MADSKLARPRASFMFNAVEWLSGFDVRVLTVAQQGRLFLKILRAVDQRDEAFLARYPNIVGQVFYRDNQQRPPISRYIRHTVFARDGRICAFCGSTSRLELDHIIPFSRGGPDTVENLRVLCKTCNLRRGNRIEES